jgi:hypothetical protein
MLPSTKIGALSALLGLSVLTCGTSSALGQPAPAPVPAQGNFRVAPINPARAFNAGAVRGANEGFRAGFRTAPINNPYWGGGFYPVDPLGSALSGAADVISAAGQSRIDTEQALQTREQTRQMKIDTRRQNFDEWLYEQNNTPSLEDRRERARMENLRRAANNPPLTEVWDATALNDLLVQTLKQMPESEGVAPHVPLAPDVIARINVTSGATLGSIGVIRDGKLSWPLPLKEEAFNDSRKRLEALIPKAMDQAAADKRDVDTFNALRNTVDQMNDQVAASVGQISTRDFIEARRYLRELEQSINTLRDPDAANFLSKKWSAQGDSVYALLSFMNGQGLRFAPATRGDQASYVALHRAMVSFLSGLGPPVRFQGVLRGPGAMP